MWFLWSLLVHVGWYVLGHLDSSIHHLSFHCVGYLAGSLMPVSCFQFCVLPLTRRIGRINHIAEHYEKQNISVWQWSPSLVVKGLLKQFSPDFKVGEAWKALVGSTPNSDRSLEWSKDNAKILKQKLEFHEGSATEIATEARMLASNFNIEIDSMAWTTNPDSRFPTIASPIEFGDTEKGGWRSTSSTMMSQGSSFQEPSTQFDIPSDIPNFI